MNDNMLLLLIPFMAIVIFLIYKKFSTRTFNLKAEKVHVPTSIVLIVKNNQRLLEQILFTLIKHYDYINEIVILDLGSIDNTLNLAKKFLSNSKKIKINSISDKTILENYYTLIKAYTKNDVIYVFDLYKISAENPNVYIPDLFHSADKISLNEKCNPDARIDGTKLLTFDMFEREKNSYILKEYVIENLSNIRMHMEILSNSLKDVPDNIKAQLKDLQEYVDKSIKDTIMINELMGFIKYSDKTLNENIIHLLKDFNQTRGITISYKVLGKEKEFKESINIMILETIRDLLYAIVRHNLCSSLEISSNYSKKYFQLVFKYNCRKKEGVELIDPASLDYYMLHSIQNRVNLIGGTLNIKLNMKDKVVLFIRIPIDTTTTVKYQGIKNEK